MAKQRHDSHEQPKGTVTVTEGTATSRRGFGSEPSRESSSLRQDGSSEEIGDTEIAARAYEIYEREGRVQGHDLEHWLRAESELRTKGQPDKSPNEAPRSARIRSPQSPAV